jgi:hypothetical protein
MRTSCQIASFVVAIVAVASIAADLLVPAAEAADQPTADAAIGGVLEGVEEYVPISHFSAVPFLVIEVEAGSLPEHNFDYWLRDELMKAGFPPGVTLAQLARKISEAGLAGGSRDSTDPGARQSPSDVLGPFLHLRLFYRNGGLGITRYRVELWDVRSETLVYAANGKSFGWKKVQEKLGPTIVAALRAWREDSILTEKEQAGATDKDRSEAT